MRRRRFLTGTAGLAAAHLAGEQTPRPPLTPYFELRFYHFNIGDQGRRLNDWTAERLLPLMTKHHFRPPGFFNVVVGPTPTLIGLLSYPSLADREAAWRRLTADPEWGKSVDALESAAEPPFERADSMLLRATPYSPQLALPSEPQKPARYFELRIYESDTERRLRALHRRFADHTVTLFRKHGLGQVFYGQGVVGGNMPHLTYMLVFDTWADREKAWAAFGADPDWIKARDASVKESGQIVSRITNMILRPTAYSAIQ